MTGTLTRDRSPGQGVTIFTSWPKRARAWQVSLTWVDAPLRPPTSTPLSPLIYNIFIPGGVYASGRLSCAGRCNFPVGNCWNCVLMSGAGLMVKLEGISAWCTVASDNGCKGMVRFRQGSLMDEPKGCKSADGQSNEDEDAAITADESAVCSGEPVSKALQQGRF